MRPPRDSFWSVWELGTAWGEDYRAKNATTWVVQRPILARNDKKVAQLLRIESGAAPVVAARLPPRGRGQCAY